MKDHDEDFAKRFRAAVAHAQVEDTQAALGKYLGVSGVTVWSYRTGEKLPRMKKAAEIAQKLGVNVNWLMTGDGDMLNINDLSPEEKLLLERVRGSSELKDAIYRFAGVPLEDSQPDQATD